MCFASCFCTGEVSDMAWCYWLMECTVSLRWRNLRVDCRSGAHPALPIPLTKMGESRKLCVITNYDYNYFIIGLLISCLNYL